VDELAGLALEVNMDSFIIGLPEALGDQLERSNEEIAPRVRKNVSNGSRY